MSPVSVTAVGRRIAELREILQGEDGLPDEPRLLLLDELATLEQRLGRLDEALRIRAKTSCRLRAPRRRPPSGDHEGEDRHLPRRSG